MVARIPSVPLRSSFSNYAQDKKKNSVYCRHSLHSWIFEKKWQEYQFVEKGINLAGHN